jgi:hypothetical protein
MQPIRRQLMTASRVCVLFAATAIAAVAQSNEGTILVELRSAKSFAKACSRPGAAQLFVVLEVGFSTNPSVDLKRVNASCAAREVTFQMPDGDYHVFAYLGNAGIKPVGKYGVIVRAGQTTKVVLHLEFQKGTESWWP